MMTHLVLARRCLTVLMALPAGHCLASQEPAAAAEKAGEPATRPAKPLVIPEASLPAGFPGPGPVNQVIVKQYPAYRSAVVADDDLPDANDNSMFFTLFDHIQKNSIAMTAPVEVQFDDSGEKPQQMGFLYARPDLGEVGKQGSVQVKDIPAMTVLSIGIRGETDAQNLGRALKKLKAHIDDNADKFQVTGPPRYMGYNSPMVPAPLRFTEVQIPIRLKDAAE